MRRYAARRYRRGFSLFGVLLGLGLAAVVIVGAVGTYNAARESATRQGWLFLPALVLRPALMLLGLILGYFVFLAAIGLFNQVWLPQMRDPGPPEGSVRWASSPCSRSTRSSPTG